MIEQGRKVALVTGAAGGIGAAIVRALAEQGVAVAALDRDKDRLNDSLAPLLDEGLAVSGFPTDVTSSAEVADTVAGVESELGPIDYLVNAAGVLRMGSVLSLTDQDWLDTFAVNANGVFYVSRAVVRGMIARESGAIVTIGSNAAHTPRTEMAAYAASKAAVTLFTKSLGLEVAKYGIRCNLVAPGSTDTPMLSSMWHDESGRQATIDGQPAAYKLGIPLAKLAQPADVSDAVLFLLSDRAGHITLQELTVDGGATLGS
ncbi:MAG: 2,3-dihydro-2,3-dihydroxybenzoate dehydrogenase [Actinomycetota bacterium]|nr:2,3-dihydro-2,3-dihydroxybenzoate dehydrogenase [Actinomycetota bacterium]